MRNLKHSTYGINQHRIAGGTSPLTDTHLKISEKNKQSRTNDLVYFHIISTLLRLVFAFVWLFLILPSGVSAQTYKNPVIPGDFPDPSVIRVGEDFYAATTSGNWAPHFPLLHSRDLINWEI